MDSTIKHPHPHHPDDDLIHRITSEVNRLHNFFVAWFCGRVQKSDDIFHSQVEDFMHSTFHLINPQGRLMTLDQLLPALKNSHGSRQGQVYAIECKNVRLLSTTTTRTTGGVGNATGRNADPSDISYHCYLVSYEEWQQIEETTTARIVSAWFVDEPDTASTRKLQWMHVHETWMPGMAPASEQSMWKPPEQ